MRIEQAIETYITTKIEYYYAACLIGVYGVWKVIKTFIGPNIEALDRFGTSFNEAFANFYVNAVAFILHALTIPYTYFTSYTSYGNFISIAIEGAQGIYVAYHCLGLTACLVYSVTIVFLPGTTLRKLIFIIIGLTIMLIANTARITSLVFLDKYSSRFWVDLNHSLIFVVMFYSILLLMHFLYLRPFLKKKPY